MDLKFGNRLKGLHGLRAKGVIVFPSTFPAASRACVSLGREDKTGVLNHYSSHRRLAKFRGLMYKGSEYRV